MSNDVDDEEVILGFLLLDFCVGNMGTLLEVCYP